MNSRVHSMIKPTASSIRVLDCKRRREVGARIDYELASLSNEIYNGNLFQDEPVQLFFFWSWEDWKRRIFVYICAAAVYAARRIVQQTAGYVYRQWQGPCRTHKLLSLSLSVNGHYINRSISCIENVCVCVCGNGPEGEFLDLLSQSQIFFVPPEGGNYIFVQVDMGQDFSTIHDEYLFSKFLKLEGNCSTRWFNAIATCSQ
jgi:hypothetical protein